MAYFSTYILGLSSLLELSHPFTATATTTSNSLFPSWSDSSDTRVEDNFHSATTTSTSPFSYRSDSSDTPVEDRFNSVTNLIWIITGFLCCSLILFSLFCCCRKPLHPRRTLTTPVTNPVPLQGVSVTAAGASTEYPGAAVEAETAAQRVTEIQAPKMAALRGERYGERRAVEWEELPGYWAEVAPPEYELVGGLGMGRAGVR